MRGTALARRSKPPSGGFFMGGRCASAAHITHSAFLKPWEPLESLAEGVRPELAPCPFVTGMQKLAPTRRVDAA